MLKVVNLKRNYRLSKETTEQALKGVTFELKAGEFVAIFGPSGCGKSTLLNALGGLDSGYEGSVDFNGQNIRLLSQGKLAEYRRDNIGFVFQNFNLIPHMTVLENVMSAANLGSEIGKNKKEAALRALDIVGLATFVSKKPNQLSGGQRQRVAIARALVNDPDVIIADEPTGALDTNTSDDVLKFLKELAEKGKLVIVVTHNQEVAAYGTRIIQMRDGLIESDKYISDFEGQFVPVNKKQKAHFGIFKTAQFALKNFMQRKGRNLLVGLGTSIGIVGIILSLSLGNGVTNEVNTLVAQDTDPRELQISKRDPITRAPLSSGVEKADYNKLIQDIGSDKVLLSSELYVFPFTMYELDGKKTEMGKFSLANGGKDTAYKNILTSSNFVQYGSVQKTNEEEGIWVTQDLIREVIGANDAEIQYNDYIGKTMNLTIPVKINNQEYTLKHQAIIKGVYKNNGIAEAPTALSYASMQKMLKENNVKDVINPYRYSVVVNSATYAEEISKRYADSREFFVGTAQTGLSLLNQIISIIQAILAFVAALSVIVAMVMIGIVLYISVIERTREIGTLKAIGYKSRNILQIFLFEAILIALVANAVAIVVAYGLSVVINQVIKSAVGINQAVLIYPVILLVIIAVSIVAAMLSGLYPAIKASRQDPATALRYE